MSKTRGAIARAFERPFAAASVAIVLASLGEIRVLDRLLFEDRDEYEFVVASVNGVLAGTPVSKSWQHRIFAPYLVRALEHVAQVSPLGALQIFLHGSVFLENALLFALLRRKTKSVTTAVAGVCAFGFARLLLTYRLEYPWDEIDVLLFFAFGYAVCNQVRAASLWPLFVVGALNHETALYMPLWFLVPGGPRVSRDTARFDRKNALFALAALGAMGAAIFGLRDALYVGRPVLPDGVFERSTPIIENHLHVLHNLRQLFFDDFSRGKVFIAAAFITALVGFGALAVGHAQRRAARWSLVVLCTIVAFGYVNETRHYLLLLAFWSAYAFPPARWYAPRSVAAHDDRGSSSR